MLCTDTKMAKKCFIDELVCFLSSHLFQAPVRTFMEEKCIIFNPEVKPNEEHTKCHEEYKVLINGLLKGFCQDAGVSVDDGIKAFSEMYTQNVELKEFLEVLYDQLIGSTDFNIFFGIMAKRNLIIQQQVLVLMLAAKGALPDVFSPGDVRPGRSAEPDVSRAAEDKEDEELLRQVLKASEEEHKKQKRLEEEETEELQRTLELSKAEAAVLQKERQQIEEKLDQLTLEAPPAAAATLAPVASSRSKGIRKDAPSKTPGPAPLKAPPRLAPEAAPSSSPAVSGSDAANMWLHSAQEEAAKHSQAHAAVAKSMAKLSEEEIRARQAYLADQRDKLIALRKQKREAQLSDAVRKQPQRPASARAARKAMAASEAPAAAATGSGNDEDERALAMRRAIADRLRQEVIGK